MKKCSDNERGGYPNKKKTHIQHSFKKQAHETKHKNLTEYN